MSDLLAALSLAGAAARTENPAQLFADAEKLYGVYNEAKQGKLDIHALANSGELKAVVQAAARIFTVAGALLDDPAQSENIAELLASI